MEPLHAVFDSYKLDELDRTWINQVSDSGFSNIENVPVNYLIFLESLDMNDLLNETCTVVKDWIVKNHDERINERDEVSWETLIAINIEVQALSAVLAYLMKKGQTFDASQDSKQSCLRAASLYFVLLSIPGSNAFQAFQPNLYEIALKSLEMSQTLISREKNFKQSDLDDFQDLINEQDSSETCLSKSQKIMLTRGLNAVTYDLVTMLKSACTSMEIRSLEITIYHLVELTKLADEPVHFERINKATVSSLAYNAYVALEKICNPKFASIHAITRIIAKYLLPLFLVGNSNLPAKQTTIVRESTLYFLKNLLVTHGKEAQSSLIILIQHAMIKYPDRLDGRQKQAVIIIKLLNLCCTNEISLKQCLKDLVRLSNHTKISCRIFAQEIIGKFLMELSNAKSHSNKERFEFSFGSKIEEILLASALGRCIDVSSMVRGRAIATLAEYTDSTERPEVRKIFQTRRDNVTNEMPDLEKLEESIESENIDSLLPDTSEIITMLKNRLEDERALVRRSALQILRNGVLVAPELLDSAVPIVREHCRDSILTVRRYAVRVLTILLETFPDTPRLCEHWVDSVVPRVFDSEAKVQEEVLDSLEKLTIDKITICNGENEVNNLPWRILNEIAINKMGDHLSRACGVWIDADRINETKISIIKSHIGTCNNVGAWLMLASISENKKLTEMENYYTFHDRSLIDPENSDIYLVSLALRVLKNCWTTFNDLILRQISRDLTSYLKNYRVKVALIRCSIDILLDITRHLDKMKNNNERDERDFEITRELVRLSETTISRLIESDDEGNSENLLFRAVCTLGHASFLSWNQISLETRRILQGFLLEWNNLPDCVRDKRELQGAAVTVLGQQSLIDRDIAVEMTPIFCRLLCNKSANFQQDVDSRKQDSVDSSRPLGINSCNKNGEDSPKQSGADSNQQDAVNSRQQNNVNSYKRNGVDSRKQNGDDAQIQNAALIDYENIANGPVVRINAAKALADICVRFTSLVEPYLADMCISMKDENPEVRQVILVIFIQLLVEDTIMIKEAFFFHILTMLADDDSTIRQMTIFLVKERLLAKNKSLINQQFLKGIYHFNDYERRTSVVNRRRKNRDSRALSLAGMENMKKRRIIYDFMLENLDSPGKLTIIVKITAHILNPRTNHNLNVLCEKGISIIRDALHIVSSDYLQPNTCSKQIIDEDNIDESAVNCPANSVIVEAIRKHRINIFLPCLVELKRQCVERKSPLVEDVTKILVRTIADCNKEALTSFYNEYPKLEREIQRDSRKYSKRPVEDSVGPEDAEKINCATPKKSTFPRHSLLINPDRMPRIVLRRLSTLMYPGTSNYVARATETSSDRSKNSKASNSSTVRNSPGKIQ